jgi:hypothetical protein
MLKGSEDDWFVIVREVAVLTKEQEEMLIAAGGRLGGSWTEVNQHIYIPPMNQLEILAQLRSIRGCRVVPVSESENIFQPQIGICGLSPKERHEGVR